MRKCRSIAAGVASVMVCGLSAAAPVSAAGPESYPLHLAGSGQVWQSLGLPGEANAKGPAAADLRLERPLFLVVDEPTTGPAARVEIAPAEPPTPEPLAPPITVARSTGPAYRGGRGLITLQGMSGMFLNPTSGTLNQGQLTAQYCVFFNDYDTDVIGHGLMLDYGVTDWLNIGVFGTAADVPGKNLLNDPIVGVGGPFARVRLVKEEGWIPEISVGGMWLDGGAEGDLLARAEGFVAASKGFAIDEDGYLRSVRVHLGARYLSRTEAPDPQDESLVYGGLELELPYSFYLVGELSSSNLNESGDEDLPYAVGVQWKPTGVIGISVAHMNPAGTQPALKEGFWFGIGLNFQF